MTTFSTQMYCSDVQSGPSGNISCEIVVGRGAVTLETSGFTIKKLDMQFLDSWLAVVLQAPGIWLAVKVMSKYVVKATSSIGVA